MFSLLFYPIQRKLQIDIVLLITFEVYFLLYTNYGFRALFFERRWLLKKILIVDDLQPFVEESRNVLKGADVQIFTANSGNEALEIHRRERVDLILLDLDMPDMTGDKVCSIIRDDPDLKFVSILMVIKLRDADIERCRKCGANDYITKPIDPIALLSKTVTLLDIPARKDYRVLMKLKISGGKDNTFFSAVSHNISINGILLQTSAALNIRDRIKCSLFLPGGSQVAFTGEIIRAEKSASEGLNYYGVRFTSITEEARDAIAYFVKNRPPA